MPARKPGRKVLSSAPIAEDLEMHVCLVTAAGREFVDLRQFIPSLKDYGRGVTVPKDAETIKRIIDGLEQV